MCKRSSYPPGYTGHQAGRYSIVGASNPAGSVGVRVSKAITKCVGREFPEPIYRDLMDDLVNPTTHSESYSKSSSRDVPGFILGNGHPTRSISPSYCNPGYARSNCIPSDCSTRSRTPEPAHPYQTLPASPQLCFDGRGTGFSVGHSRETDLWVSMGSSTSANTEYRDRYQAKARKALAPF